ncbi:hypothetical protein T4A_6242 [Trichinella pseudospiralis]|uniref:Uncharacterized protein n=1 Tax=Trichinella pseudospiralis TaxID=6337 RepID=A0A0V1E9E8_TRIPS|nr:hypothetical protein T4A_6242 [Trichinella pseudospiralis]
MDKILRKATTKVAQLSIKLSSSNVGCRSKKRNSPRQVDLKTLSALHLSPMRKHFLSTQSIYCHNGLHHETLRFSELYVYFNKYSNDDGPNEQQGAGRDERHLVAENAPRSTKTQTNLLYETTFLLSFLLHYESRVPRMFSCRQMTPSLTTRFEKTVGTNCRRRRHRTQIDLCQNELRVTTTVIKSN